MFYSCDYDQDTECVVKACVSWLGDDSTSIGAMKVLSKVLSELLLNL